MHMSQHKWYCCKNNIKTYCKPLIGGHFSYCRFDRITDKVMIKTLQMVCLNPKQVLNVNSSSSKTHYSFDLVYDSRSYPLQYQVMTNPKSFGPETEPMETNQFISFMFYTIHTHNSRDHLTEIYI